MDKTTKRRRFRLCNEMLAFLRELEAETLVLYWCNVKSAVDQAELNLKTVKAVSREYIDCCRL